MSTNIKKMDLNGVLSPETLIKLSGVEIKDDLKSTLDFNINVRVNGEFLTPTKIIFNYVRFVNSSLDGVNDKKAYIKTAKNLLNELKKAGFVIGAEWRGDNSNKLPYSKGNSKLSKDTVIINLSPASLCISKNLHLCELCDGCYALSSERRYLNTLIYRLTQLIRFEELSVDEIISPMLRMRVISFLRVNEAGDIFNMADVFKLLEISSILWEKKGVITYLYTHRRDIWDKIKSLQTPYFKVNRSGVDFKASPVIKNHHNSLYCDGECNNCIYCKIELDIDVTAPYHGDLICKDERDEETIKRDEMIKKVSYEMYMDGDDVDEISSHIKSMLGGF